MARDGDIGFQQSKDNMAFDIPRYKDAPFHSNNVIRWIWFFCGGERVKLTLFLAVALMRRTFTVLFPLYVAKAIEFVETGQAFSHPNVIWRWIIIYAVIAFIISALLMVMARYNVLADKISRVLSLFSIRHLMALPHSWHEQSGSGGKLQQVIIARQSFRMVMDIIAWDVTTFIASILALIISIAVMDVPPIFYVFYGAFLVSYLYVSIITIPRLDKYLDRSRAVFERISSTVYEFVNSITTVKSFNLSKRIIRIGQSAEHDGFKAEEKYLQYRHFRWVLINTVALVWVITIVAFAYQTVLDKDISVAAFALVSFMAFQSWNSFEHAVMYYTHYVENSNGVMRLIRTLKQKAHIIDRDDAKDLNISKGIIEFSNLDFQYNQKTSVFAGLNLTINPNEKIGIVGKSGAGKSTLVNLLLRFYDTQDGQGTIKIDNQNIRDVTLYSLREAISVIPQDTTMFNHSIMDNIRYGRLEASDDEVIVAAKQAHADEFIQNLPEGYQTLVGERGLKLSGGQRQRIAIARAILKDAPILILDEATSALDSESETLIQKSLMDVMGNKTVIAIAHRLSTLAAMDRIIVMDAGKIVQDGTHDDLVKTEGIYKTLWDTQSGGFIVV